MDTLLNVNIEILKGCRNTKCICWNKTCKQSGVIKEMEYPLLINTLKTLSKYPISNIALYGLGESLYHSNINTCIDITRKFLPNVPIHLNTDVNMLLDKKDYIPRVDYFNICHKEHVTPLRYLSIPRGVKVTHIFILSKITNSILKDIDNYIDHIFSINHVDNHFMIGSIWDFDFGSPVIKKLFPLETEDGIVIFGDQPKKRICTKVYINVDGIVKKCFFSKKEYKLRDLLETYDRTECESCNMGAYKYLIDIKSRD